MKTAILHYSLPPGIGGVESVIHAHTNLLLKAGFPVRLIAGEGDASALPEGAEFKKIPEMYTRHPRVAAMEVQLEAGQLPADFEPLSAYLEQSLLPALEGVDHVIIHNIFSKHFNLPLTAALARLLDRQVIAHAIAWCHDFTWISPNSRSKVHPGYPWDLLRTYREDVTYVTVSHHQQAALVDLLHWQPDQVKVVHNGVDPTLLYGLSTVGKSLIDRLDLDKADLILLMPVRITQAKNIEFGLQVTAILKALGARPVLVVTGPPDPHSPQDAQYLHSLLDLRAQLDLESEARFVYEIDDDAHYTIGPAVVRQLYRLSDILFMPSHREGFGMPVLEAGLIGMPVFSTDIPAAVEIGGSQVVRFSHHASAKAVAQSILEWAHSSQTYQLKQRIRRSYTWQAIFHRDILPLLTSR